MPSFKVSSKIPEPRLEAVWIALESDRGKLLGSPSTLKAHPGSEDLERVLGGSGRNGSGLQGAYLCAGGPPLIYFPAVSAKHARGAEHTRTLAAQAYAAAKQRKAGEVVFLLDSSAGAGAAAEVAEGICLGDYRFDKYLSGTHDDGSPDGSPEGSHDDGSHDGGHIGSDPGHDEEQAGERAGESDAPPVTLLVPASMVSRVRRAVKERVGICGSVNRARDLVNEPGSVATPAEIESRATAVAENSGLEIEVWDAKRLKKEGYEGLLTVGRGGNVKPRMIVLRYEPKSAKAKTKSNVHLGLLGKGVTFDTGGVSIKPSANMWQMKGDMGGAAAVLYGMEAIARAKPKVRVTAVIVTAQNYVDAESVLPGDIMRAKNGKTIQIDNTDAEGRLILTDGLFRMGEEGVTHLVDLATLTGAIVRALGNSVTGAFGNDKFVDRVVRVADKTGEACWKMPMVEEYRDNLKCDIADINNMATTPNGGAIHAALFLREFVPGGVSWTHLDIAGTFIVTGSRGYYGPGATGVMVRTLRNLADEMAVG